MPSSLPHDDRVAAWRVLFPVTERWIYLNHAAVSPISRPVHDAMRGLADDVLANGVAHAPDWWRHFEEIRGDAARLLGTKPRNVAFAKNTSEGISFAATGVDWRPGDEVVTAAMEFPANRFPWLALADRGVVTRLVPSDDGTLPADRLIGAMTDRTRVLAVSAVQYIGGYRADLEALGRACREREMLFVVDGIQMLGALPLEPEPLGIDVLAADAHKWLLGPEGIGIAWFSDRALDRLRVTEIGWASSATLFRFEEETFRLHPDARRFECGTPTTIALYGLGAACRLIDEIGTETIGERVLALAECVRQHARARGWRIFGSDRPEHTSGIVSFDAGVDPVPLAKSLLARGVQVSARGGFVRVAAHFYNTGEEIDRAFAVMDEVIAGT